MKQKQGCHVFGAWLRNNFFALALFAALAAAILQGIGEMPNASRTEQLRLAEQAVRRAAVSCYAVEGFYPDSFADLKEHYHVRIDEEKFVVQYEVFGSNLMPEITVLEVAG